MAASVRDRLSVFPSMMREVSRVAALEAVVGTPKDASFTAVNDSPAVMAGVSISSIGRQFVLPTRPVIGYAKAMCGRYAFYTMDFSALAEAVHQPDLFADAEARYNVAPGTLISVARRTDGEAPVTTEQLWWGYRPAWADATAPQPINAKAETVATSKYFASAFQRHRCLIPADGWFEWLNVDGRKQPHYLTRTDRQTLYLAGIWTERGGDLPPGVAIITEPARGRAGEVHDRMPLALDNDSLEPWLDPAFTEREAIRGVTRHIRADAIEHWPVSTAVNKPSDDGNAALINPL